MRLSYLIVLLFLNFLWAGTLSAYKILGEYLAPGEIVALRFGLAGLVLLPFWPFLKEAAPRGRDLLVTGLLGLLVFVLGHRLQVYGNKLSTAANTSVLMAVEPLLTSIAAAVFLRERIGPRRIAGFGFALLGVLLLNGVWRRDVHWVGVTASLIFMASFICEAAYSILGKPLIRRASAIKVLTLSLLLGSALNLVLESPTIVSKASALPLRLWWILLLLSAACTSFGYAFWFKAIRECDVSVVALTIYSQPVFGVLLARSWVGEQLHWGHFWGSVAICIGLVIGLSRQIRSSTHSGAGPV